MTWEKQLNVAARRTSPRDVMAFSRCKITLGKAAQAAICADKFHSVDILLDLAKRPLLALQLHENGRGEFKVHRKKGMAEIGCFNVMGQLLKLGIGPGRYHYTKDSAGLLVFDLSLPPSKLGGRE
jgi:hypothetical protein